MKSTFQHFRVTQTARLLAAAGFLCAIVFSASAAAAERMKVSIRSTADGSDQPCYVILPDGFDAGGEAMPLLVSLHTWSGNLEQRNKPLEEEANRRGWIYLFPNFRGRNDNPAACGSLKAQQDILDAVAWARKKYPVDPKRIYLTGVSGGGHMTMLMVGRHPELWAAASAWVGISDLSSWHERHKADNYGAMLRKCCDGRPGDNPAVDEQYRARSPISHLHRAAQVPVDIAAGVHDGHTGSVPIRHSLDAFNAIAKAAGGAQVRRDRDRTVEPQRRPAGKAARFRSRERRSARPRDLSPPHRRRQPSHDLCRRPRRHRHSRSRLANAACERT